MIRAGVITLITTLAITPALAQPYEDGHMGRDWGWGSGWGHMFGGGILMIVIWVAIIAVIVYLVLMILRQTKRDSGRAGRSALDILEERYARGEINRQDYEARREDLLRDREP